MKRLAALASAALLTTCCMLMPYGALAEANHMNVTVDLSAQGKPISPLIYGVNQYSNNSSYRMVKANAIRQGGNRTTAYNWETNASNAGADWHHSSDNHLGDTDEPAAYVATMINEANFYGIPYKLATLQLAGYVSADKNGNVSEAETAPSARFNRVVLTKGAPFAETPDLTDGVVYMDEYVNYIITKYGDSQSPKGIQAYSLDNEPALWHHTHPRVHPEPVGVQELADKSIEMARAVKALDPNAEIFGPALYGYTAFDHLADDEISDEWEKIKEEKGYHWYLDCYLDQMRQAEEQYGMRLLDVLDIHYYSESARISDQDRVQSVRTLYEEGFSENSWIGQWCMENVPILDTVLTSIETYYPGTKLAITEYNFGGDNESATIAMTEALGCFAEKGVYFASIWGGNGYQFAGINLYTNYDKKGGAFGDLLVPAKTDDVSLCSAYAAVSSADKNVVTISMTNKSETQPLEATIHMNGGDSDWQTAEIWAVSGSSKIRLLENAASVSGSDVTVTLPAYSAAMVVIRK